MEGVRSAEPAPSTRTSGETDESSVRACVSPTGRTRCGSPPLCVSDCSAASDPTLDCQPKVSNPLLPPAARPPATPIIPDKESISTSPARYRSYLPEA
jgi:hypothetical protein